MDTTKKIIVEYDWKANTDNVGVVLEYATNSYDGWHQGWWSNAWRYGGKSGTNPRGSWAQITPMSLSNGTWYHIKIIFDNKHIIGEVYNGDALIYSSEYDSSIETQLANLCFNFGYFGSSDGKGYNDYLKNISYKIL